MLLRLRKPLDPLYDILVVLALYGNGDGQATHYQQSSDIGVLCDGLEVGHVQRTRGLVKDIREVLRH